MDFAVVAEAGLACAGVVVDVGDAAVAVVSRLVVRLRTVPRA